MLCHHRAEVLSRVGDMIHFPEHEKPWLFEHIEIDPRARILVLAPHPDDFDAIGVSMRCLHDQGNPIYVGVMSSGSSGVEDRFCMPPTPDVKRRIREREQRASCAFFDLPSGRLTF